jgi:hypothetical protein
MKRRLGITIFRREVTLVLADRQGGKWQIINSQSLTFSPGEWRSTLRDGLQHMRDDARNCEVSIALSPAYTSCADSVELPLKSESKLESMSASLAEARCVGDTTEELAVDLVKLIETANGCVIHLLAVRRDLVKSLVEIVQEILPRAHLTIISSVPIVLAKALRGKPATNLMLKGAQELLVFKPEPNNTTNWEAHPLNVAQISFSSSSSELKVICEDDIIDLAGTEIAARFFAAFQVLIQGGEGVCNVLRDRNLPQTRPNRMFPIALQFIGAMALLFIALGIYLNSRIACREADLNRCESLEHSAWSHALPGIPFQSDQLDARLNKLLALNVKNKEVNAGRSALELWSEIANSMPPPDGISFSLDTLQIGPDGARMNGHVAIGKSDPLAFASSLENELNSSETLNARGEFETSKEGDVAVRMRIDEKARPAGAPKQ